MTSELKCGKHLRHVSYRSRPTVAVTNDMLTLDMLLLAVLPDLSGAAPSNDLTNRFSLLVSMTALDTLTRRVL